MASAQLTVVTSTTSSRRAPDHWRCHVEEFPPFVTTHSKPKHLVHHSNIVPYLLEPLPNHPDPRRPRAPTKWTQWPFATQQAHRLPNALSSGDPWSQGLRNPGNLCYRNTALQLMLSTPVFWNWSNAHVEASPWGCQIRDCLLCSYHRFALEYIRSTTANTPVFQQRTDEFWGVCQKVFWGSRAMRKHRIGPKDVDKQGFNHFTFLVWLLHFMREQVRNRPSETQAFERLFTLQVQMQPKCSNDDCSHIFYKDYNSAQYFIALLTTAKETTISYMLDRVTRYTIDEGELCPACQEADCSRCDVELIGAPEVLIVFVDRGHEDIRTPVNDFLRIKLEDHISLPLAGNQEAKYTLNALTLIRHFQGLSHVVSAVRSRHGRYWLIDDDKSEELIAFSEVDDMQRAPTPEDQMLWPSLFLYVRTDRPKTTNRTSQKNQSTPVSVSSPAPATRSSPASCSAPTTRSQVQHTHKRPRNTASPGPNHPAMAGASNAQMVADFQTAFPDVSEERIRMVLERNKFTVSKACKEMIRGPKATKQQLYSLDDLPILFRAEFLKVYAKLPHISLPEMFIAMNSAGWKADKAVEKLEDRTKLQLYHTETVGGAEITLQFDIAPCDANKMVSFDSQDLSGTCSYELAGKAWKGHFHGKLFRTDLES